MTAPIKIIYKIVKTPILIEMKLNVALLSSKSLRKFIPKIPKNGNHWMAKYSVICSIMFAIPTAKMKKQLDESASDIMTESSSSTCSQ